jgi:hypothetical protein
VHGQFITRTLVIPAVNARATSEYKTRHMPIVVLVGAPRRIKVLAQIVCVGIAGSLVLGLRNRLAIGGLQTESRRST